LANHIQMNMSSSDPQTRAQAMDAWSHLPNVALERMKLQQEGANAANVAGINQQTQFGVNQMNIDAGRWNKNSMDYLKWQANAKANFQQQAGIAKMEYGQYQDAFSNATNPDEKEFYKSKMQQAKQDYDQAVANDYRAKQAAGQTGLAGKVDTNALGIPTVVSPGSLPTPPGMAVPTPTPGPTDTGSVIMKDRNGTTHKVPSDKVNQALQFGWTK